MMKFREFLKEKYTGFSDVCTAFDTFLGEATKGVTNTPVPEDKRAEMVTSPKVLKIINAVETTGVTFSYPSGSMKNHLRFVVDVGTQNQYGVIMNKGDRPSFCDGIKKYIIGKKLAVQYTDAPELDHKKVYIRNCKRGDKTIAFMREKSNQTTIQNSFSSAGGIELYDAGSGVSYFIDLEIKGDARSDSAVNTKLREVTPCVLFELIARGIGTYEIQWNWLNSFFTNPDGCFKNLRQQIDEVATKDGAKRITRLKESLGEDVDIDAIKECFDFDEKKPENAFRMKAYRVGVITLKTILEKYNIPAEQKFVERIKYSGLSTMTDGLTGGTEDVMVVQSYNAKTKETTDIKISLKSGVHKSRETTFLSLAKFIGMFDIKFEPVKKSGIKDNTLYVKSEKLGKTNVVTENPETFAKLFFEIMDKANATNKKLFADKIKKFVLPDEDMEIWNVTEDSFEDLKGEYLDFYGYKYVNIKKASGANKYYVIEMNNGSSDINDHFVFRWYKRVGKGSPSEYKILAEPNKTPTEKKTAGAAKKKTKTIKA